MSGGRGGAERSTRGPQGLISLTFLVLLVVCLLTPLAYTIVPVLGPIVPALEERRQPTPFPGLQLLAGQHGDFAAALNAWFDDRMGFRDLLIRTKNQIDFTAFATSSKVAIGRDGWLFDYPNLATERLDHAGMAELEDTFVFLASRLRERGIYLIVVGYSDKSSVYPEKAPPIVAAAHRPNYERLKRFLSNRSDLTFIDAEAILRSEKAKTEEPLYLKTDLHVTQYAQQFIVRKIIETIALREGDTEIVWSEDTTLDHSPGGFNGSQMRFLSLLFPWREPVAFFRNYYRIGGEDPEGTWDVPDPDTLGIGLPRVGRPYDWQFRAHPQLCQDRLPPTVVFGNSFSDGFWALGLHRYFCSIRRARDPLNRLRLFVATIPEGTRYFVYQFYEPTFLGGIELIRTLPPPRSRPGR